MVCLQIFKLLKQWKDCDTLEDEIEDWQEFEEELAKFVRGRGLKPIGSYVNCELNVYYFSLWVYRELRYIEIGEQINQYLTKIIINFIIHVY